jgi:division protein CdvB (Snf7/Vps24/ESCRT-III family)
MASMNRGLNLPQIQRIMTEFEKESSMMDMKEEMMSDAVDDVMDEEEDEEEEGDKILKQVLDEIGVDLSQQVRSFYYPSQRVFEFFAISAYRCSNWHCDSIQDVGRPATCRVG